MDGGRFHSQNNSEYFGESSNPQGIGQSTEMMIDWVPQTSSFMGNVKQTVVLNWIIHSSTSCTHDFS